MNANPDADRMPRRVKPSVPPIRGKTVFLVRHGSIQDDPAAKRFIGQTDLPLNDHGRRQARHWKSWLAKEALTAIYCSDLARCTETAHIIGPGGFPPVETVPELREIHLGQWEGLSFARVRQRWPEAFRQRGEDLAGFRPPGGESFRDLRHRVVPAFENVVRRTAGNLLIVAHAGVNRLILAHILGMSVDHLFRIAQSPGAMNMIERRSDGWRIHLVNLSPSVDYPPS